MTLTRDDLENRNWEFLTPLGDEPHGVYSRDEYRILVARIGKEREARESGHLVAAAPTLALACLDSYRYIDYLEGLLIDLGHPFAGCEPPELTEALEAAGVEVPSGD